MISFVFRLMSNTGGKFAHAAIFLFRVNRLGTSQLGNRIFGLALMFPFDFPYRSNANSRTIILDVFNFVL